MRGRVLVLVAAACAALGLAGVAFGAYVASDNDHKDATNASTNDGVSSVPLKHVTVSVSSPAPASLAKPAAPGTVAAKDAKPVSDAERSLAQDFAKLGLDDPVTPEDESSTNCKKATVTVVVGGTNPVPRLCLDGN